MNAQPKNFVVVRDDAPKVAQFNGAVAAIGNFDGVHRGHRAVIDTAIARAQALGSPAIAVTFEPHPRKLLRPDDPVFRLTSEKSKLRLLAATGLDGALVLTFDAAFASLSAEDFVTRILVGRLGIRGATIGFDFHFGHQRGGSPEFLSQQGERYGFTVETAPPLEDEGRPVSSSSIRAALSEGRVVEAAELLGYPWFAAGTVQDRRPARTRARLSDRQHRARSGLRAEARHLCGARRHRRHDPRRRRELRHTADLR